MASVRLPSSLRNGVRSSACESILPIYLPVGAMLVDTTATLVDASRPARLAGVDEAKASKASSTPIRPGTGSPSVTVDTTGPAFCERPGLVGGRGVDTGDLRGGGQHGADRHDTGTTDTWHRMATSAGTASVGRVVVTLTLPSWPSSLAGLTVMNAGQSPFRQLASTLQLAWSITVLRPNSVSVECSDRQFDFTPQSPQASQTRSSIITRNAAWARMPRLRSRRFSAAHC